MYMALYITNSYQIFQLSYYFYFFSWFLFCFVNMIVYGAMVRGECFKASRVWIMLSAGVHYLVYCSRGINNGLYQDYRHTYAAKTVLVNGLKTY